LASLALSGIECQCTRIAGRWQTRSASADYMRETGLTELQLADAA
jgi:hypothetical protein